MPQFINSHQKKGTVIHRLNPVVKIVWASSIVLLAMLVDHPVILALLFLSTIPVVAVGDIWRPWAVIMQIALWMGVVVVIINSLASPGGSHLLWQSGFSLPVIGYVKITLEAVLYGLFMAVRLMAIISAFSVITLTVSPDELLSALLEMRLPYKTAMMAALSIRFVPTMFDDAARITDAQRSRGLEMDKGNKIKRLVSRSTVLSSLLSVSLERTIQLAESMESRGFGNTAKRTRYYRVTFNRFDIIMLVLLFVMLAAAFYFLLSGDIAFEYYPSLNGFDLNVSGIVMSIVLMSVLAGLVPIAWLGGDKHNDNH